MGPYWTRKVCDAHAQMYREIPGYTVSFIYGRMLIPRGVNGREVLAYERGEPA